MPVRTDRGRVAVYRKIWGWPLRSPRNLTVTVIVAAMLGVGIALLAAAVGATSSTPTNATAAASNTTRPPATTPSPTTRTSPSTSTTDTSSAGSPTATSPATPVSPSTGPAPSGTELATVVAGEFMARWVNHPAGITSKQWAAQLTPYVVPEFVVLLESVDPANIPATTVTGDPVVTAESPTVVEVNVSTDGGVLHLVLLAQPDGTWLVRSYDMAS